MDITYTNIQDRSLSWLSTGISRKCCVFTTNLLSEVKWCDHVRLFLHVFEIADPLIWPNDQRIKTHKCSRYSEPDIQAFPLFVDDYVNYEFTNSRNILSVYTEHIIIRQKKVDMLPPKPAILPLTSLFWNSQLIEQMHWNKIWGPFHCHHEIKKAYKNMQNVGMWGAFLVP